MNQFYNNIGMITEVKWIQKENEFGSSIQRELQIVFKKKKKNLLRDRVQVWKQVDFPGWRWATEVETNSKKNTENGPCIALKARRKAW